MVNAQKWFDKNYPKSKREKITELDISEKENAPNNKKLIGTLKLEGFNSLKKLNCAGNLLVSLEIKDLPHFTSLDCSHNKITSLNIVNCPKFESLIAFDNLLVDLTFLDNFDPKKLTVLGLGDNNLLSQDLSIFSEFTNLTKLTVHSVRENKVQQGIYNRFHGSLEPLKNFTKLEHLDISGTDIDSGLEYLPLNKLGFFLCGNEARPEAKVVKIYAVCGNNNHLETLQKKTLGFDKGKLQKYQTDFWKQKNEKMIVSSSQQVIQDQLIVKDWKDIHEDFRGHSGRLYKREWKDIGFEFNQTKTLIDAGLDPKEWIFAWWITEKQNKTPEQLNHSIVEKSREKFNNYLEQLGQKWINVHPDFNLLNIVKWTKRGLDSQETKRWIEAGLTIDDYELAEHLKKSKFTPTQYSSFKSKSTQEWIDYFFPREKRNNIKKLNIDRKKTNPDGKKLTGSLKLEGFTSLEELDFSFNEITDLELSQCPNLRNIFSNDNLLTNLNFLNSLDSEKLEEITVDSNNLQTTNLTPFSRFVNLKELWLGNSYKEKISQDIYNRFIGSLEPLKNMNDLRILNINNIDVDSGLEYLPDSIQSLCCSFDKRSESKVKAIAEELKKFGEPEKRLLQEDNFTPLLGKLREELLKGRIRKQETEFAKHKEISQRIIGQLKEENQKLQLKLEEQEKTKNNILQKEHSFYKYFFDNYLQSKKTELTELRNKLNKEEQEWLDIYFEANQEAEKSSFVKKQLARAKENLKEKLSEKELELILEKRMEINELENQFNNLQIQEAQIEIPPK